MEDLELEIEEELIGEQLKAMYGDIPEEVPTAPVTHGVEEAI